MKNLLQRVAALQLEYSKQNTPQMRERGEIIRNHIPAALKKYLPIFKVALGPFGDQCAIEGRDGIGGKTQAPWVRVFSKTHSPSATEGWYCVIHFSTNGKNIFIAVGCGATTWDPDRKDLIKLPKEELAEKIAWARSRAQRLGIDTSEFSDQIEIGSSLPLPKAFERATAFCKRIATESVTDEDFVSEMTKALKLLRHIYDWVNEFGDLKASDIALRDVENAINPGQTSRQSSGQGIGLSFAERRAVELRAMQVARDYLISNSFTVTDVSAKESFDFLAVKGNEIAKVEVKGTTSSDADAVLMTANEVNLHRKEAGTTALAIVKDIRFTNRGESPLCESGNLEFIYPWDIDQWVAEPRAFVLRRK